jgi:hypothetical protein
MSKTVIGLVAAACVFATGLAMAAMSRATSLAREFPELADLSETKTVVIGIQWLGLSPLSPMKADYLLELHDDQFVGPGGFRVADGPTVTRQISVPADVMRGFLAVASKVPMTEGEYRPRIEHTDDYPSLEFGVETKRGVLHIGSHSQLEYPTSGTHVDRTPWGIAYLNRSFIVITSDLDRAYEPFDQYLRDDEIFEELSQEVMKSGR